MALEFPGEKARVRMSCFVGKYPSRYEVTITFFKSGLILPKPVAPVGYSTAVIMFNLRSSISSPPHKNFCPC